MQITDRSRRKLPSPKGDGDGLSNREGKRPGDIVQIGIVQTVKAVNNKCLLKTSDSQRHDTARNDGDAVLVEVVELAVMRCLVNRTSLRTSLHHPIAGRNNYFVSILTTRKAACKTPPTSDDAVAPEARYNNTTLHRHVGLGKI